MAPPQVKLQLLGGNKGVDGTLAPAVAAWRLQFKDERIVEARVANKGILHDRLLIDDRHAWVLSQSIKDFAAKSPGSILRADAELTALKREAFLSIWEQSRPL